MKISVYMPNDFIDSAKSSFLNEIPKICQKAFALDKKSVSCYLFECREDVVSESARGNICIIVYTHLKYNNKQRRIFGDDIVGGCTKHFGKKMETLIIFKESDETNFAFNGKMLAQN